ncbi:MAG: hypothetical protein PHW83_01265 [Bacteroidales bacterium]|nr:hypothetical protein [Bacteroidales bacterium]
MAKVKSEIAEAIKKLERSELEKIILRAAGKYPEFHDSLFATYTDKQTAEAELFEIAQKDIELLFCKRYKGFSEELQFANMLAACHKRINDFSKLSKNKCLELDLVLHVLEFPFSLKSNAFETCFTNFNYRVALLVKKAIGIYNKLDEDYKIDYTDKINNYLEILHRTCNYLDFIYVLPAKV